MRADNSVRAERTRALLLEAALGAFAERGFHGTSTRNIAERAGLSSAALYVHHQSKEELLFEISKAGHEETLAIVQRAAASSDDHLERLSALVHDYVLFHVEKHTMARVINYEMAALTPEHRAHVRRIRHQIDTVIHGVLTSGVEASVFTTPDPRMTAVALESLGIDIARWYRPNGGWDPKQIAAAYVEMGLRLLGVD
jgi:AcrR family transcriptional regulator